MTEEATPPEATPIYPLEALGEYIANANPGAVAQRDIIRNELILTVTPTGLRGVLTFLRDDKECLFKQLSDLCGVDYPERPQRFEVVYNLLSFRHNVRLRIKVLADEQNPVPSIADIYPAAGWYEREAWDMYGILFADNPDLRRILTDYGFDGHPQRRDFPLTGYVEMRYDVEKKRVVYEPVKLNQAYRSFDFLSPWEGGYYHTLPGDEKAAGGKA